jgi:hypothetical protein
VLGFGDWRCLERCGGVFSKMGRWHHQKPARATARKPDGRRAKTASYTEVAFRSIAGMSLVLRRIARSRARRPMATYV